MKPGEVGPELPSASVEHDAETTAATTPPDHSAGAIAPAVLDALDRSRHAELTRAPDGAFGNLALAFVLDAAPAPGADTVDVRIGNRIVPATLSPHVHPAVLKTAAKSGEPVLIERGADGSVAIVGALRTHATPGVDEIKDLKIEADRIHLKGKKEVVLSTEGVATLALRAVGEIETYADRIVSRAEELHKIVGRMLRLN